MKTKLQVFVSSTYTDMMAERQAAVEAILRAGHIPAGMELFAAGDDFQWETIRRWIDDSDVFMLILGGRYGSVEPKSKKAYIQLEYEYAMRNRKPLFAAVISEAYLETKIKSVGSSAVETSNGAMLKTFRELVTKRICRFFDDVNELKLIVFESLSTFERNDGLVGWIRGSDVLDLKAILEEVTRLQAENALLHEKVNKLEEVGASTGNAARQQQVEVSLSSDAKTLLVAAMNGDGYIFGGSDYDLVANDYIRVVNEYFYDENSTRREKVRWKSAFKELATYRLIEDISLIGGFDAPQYGLTQFGYSIADEIGATTGSIHPQPRDTLYTEDVRGTEERDEPIPLPPPQR